MTDITIEATSGDSPELPNGKTANPSLRNNRSFHWLWIGGAASFLGDYLTFIAFPWLVLSLTSETWVLGAVLALMGIPRGIFIFIGGAFVDRLSPKVVLLFSKYVNAFLLLSLSALIYLQQLSIPLLCIYALLIGIGSALAIPAGNSILPGVVGMKSLEKANSVFFSLHKLAMFVGPLLAGLLLAANPDGQIVSVSSANGTSQLLFTLALLFGLDGLTFVFSALTVQQVHYKTNKGPVKDKNIFRSIAEGFIYFWQKPQLRAVILYIAAVNCVIGGLMLVGLPVLVKQQLQMGGDTFGYLTAANGLGTILGVFIAVKFRDIGKLSLGMTFLLGDILVGLIFSCFYNLNSLTLAYGLLFSLGVIAGYLHLAVYTWVQKQPSTDMLGRVMAIMMFTIMGLAPIAASMYGVILDSFAVGNVFLSSGIMLSILALLGMTSRQLRTIERT